VTDSAAGKISADAQDSQDMRDISASDLRRGLVIAVDGPSGSGKSTAARRVAGALGLRYLDTGSMYRALTWWLLHQEVDPADNATVLRRLEEPVITVVTDPQAPRTMVNGTEVGSQIRTREVSNAVSAVAAIPQVRRVLVGMQQEIIAEAIAAGAGIVAEGRDIGTVVAPRAPVKVYLTASETARAQRRSADLADDPAATVATIQREQARRDRKDSGQMAMAGDAVEIDTTALGPDDVVDEIIRMARGWMAVSRG
jgi:cytidylate kinase